MPSKLYILENRPKWLLPITFRGLQRVGLLRGREKIVYWCMPLFLLCFLSSFYHLLSLFLSILFTLSFLLLSCRGLFLLGSFLFLGPSLWVPPPLSASLRCLLLSYHRILPSVPPSSMATSPFYSKLIQWDFSPLPLGFHQLFLVCCGYSFKTTHQLISCLAITFAQYILTAPLLISWQNSFLFVLVVYLYL